MKRCKKINKYAYGANAIQNWGEMSDSDKTDLLNSAGSFAADVAGNVSGKKDLTFGSTLSSTLSGATTGASIGGPIGAGVGAAIGLGTSLVGRKSEVNPVTGEIDYGSGFGKWFGRSAHSLEQESGRIKSGILSRNNAEQLAANYYMNHGYNGISLAADGGILPNTLAYLDDGEFIRTPNGNIAEIPEENKPTDSNLTNVPVGTQVLSDKLKVPGTGKTFAEMYKKMTNRKRPAGNDRYAENSNKLNNMNDQLLYQQLLEQQEALKSKRKNNIPAYADGTKETGTDRVAPRLKTYDYNKDMSKFKYWDNKANDYKQEYKNFVGNLTGNDVKDIFSGKYGDMSTYLSKNKNTIPTVDEAKALMTDKRYGDWHKMSEKFADTKLNQGPAVPMNRSFAEPLSRTIDVPLNNVANKGPYTGIWHYNATPDKINAYYGNISSPRGNNNARIPNIDLGDLAANAAALAGPFANLNAKSEPVDIYTYDPVYGPTEYNIDPLLRQIALTDSMSRYNMANINPNTGANMAYGLQSAQVRNKAIADAYSQKFNAETPLAFQNAQIANTWGQQYANALHTAAIEQAQNDAAARTIRNQGFADLSTRIQQLARDRKLMKRDRGLYNAMEQYLSKGMTLDQIEDLNRYFK